MCTNMITLKRTIAGKTFDELVPCGVCPECLKKKQSGFVVRTIEEVKKRGTCCFVTLTYNDDNLPKNDGVPTLCREHLKKWKRETRTKYYRLYHKNFPEYGFLLCGEYGPRTNRPHYHGLLLGLDKPHLDFMEKYWQDRFGFTVFKQVPTVSLDGSDDITKVARYVAKYCIKPAEVVKNNFELVEKPRIMTSKFYGLPDDVKKMKDYYLCGRNDLSTQHLSMQDVVNINSNLNYQHRGFRYSLPLYYRKKFFYEKGINGNLKASPLSKVCKVALRGNINENFDNAVKSLASSEYKGDFVQASSVVVSREKINLQSRQDSNRKDLLRQYKSSKF